MSSTVLEQINVELVHLTCVTKIVFSWDASTGECSVSLKLQDNVEQPRRHMTLLATGVANFSLLDLGGGVTQLRGLCVTDISHLQHDRIFFVLEDQEDEACFLRCRSVTLRSETSGQELRV